MSPSSRRISADKKGGPGKRPYLWFVGLLLVAFAAAAVISLTRGDDSSTDGAQGDGSEQADVSEANDVSVDGSPIPRLQDVEANAGIPAPQATGVNFTGETVTLLEAGKPTVIGFFAHWCPHCQTEVDELSKHLSAVGLPQDVNVVAVSTSVDSTQANFPPSAWFESEGWPTPVLTDDATSSIAVSYGLSAFPFWAIVDAEGQLMLRTAGGIGPEQFDAFVELARTGN